MELEVTRRPTVTDTTLGTLTVDGQPQCYTLEDVVREVEGQPVESWKIPGVTAIPRGRYEVVVEYSPKFGKDTLTLRNVPGFTFIRIHAGNTDEDTDGCLLVGNHFVETVDGDNLRESRKALAALKAKILPVIRTGEMVWLTIVGPTNPPLV